MRKDGRYLTQLQEWNSRRTAQRPSKFPRESATEVSHTGTRWEESFFPLTAADFARLCGGAHPNQIPGVRLHTVPNARGIPEEVVLMRAGPPKLVLYRSSEAERSVFHLFPQDHLRREQGDEHWSALAPRAMQLPAAPTPETLALLARQHGRKVNEAFLREFARSPDSAGGGPWVPSSGGTGSAASRPTPQRPSGAAATYSPAEDEVFEQVVESAEEPLGEVAQNPRRSSDDEPLPLQKGPVTERRRSLQPTPSDEGRQPPPTKRRFEAEAHREADQAATAPKDNKGGKGGSRRRSGPGSAPARTRSGVQGKTQAARRQRR